jgi:hypothetical protein
MGYIILHTQSSKNMEHTLSASVDEYPKAKLLPTPQERHSVHPQATGKRFFCAVKIHMSFSESF